MMLALGTVHCFMLLLGQLIFFDVIEAQQDQLVTTIQDENGDDINLHWIKSEQYLANKHLPVFSARLGQSITRHENIMAEIGEFETYYDLDGSSAVVLIKKNSRLFGVIGVKYLIIGLPVRKLNQKQVIGASKYVFINPDPKESTQPTDVVPPAAKDTSHLPLKKRPIVNVNQLDFDPDVPSTSQGIIHSSHVKRPRTDQKDANTLLVNVDPPTQDSLLRNILISTKTSSNESPAEPGNFLKKMLARPNVPPFYRGSIQDIVKPQPKIPTKDSDSNKLLRLLLQSPCQTVPERTVSHLGTFYPEILIFVSHDIVKIFHDVQSVDGYSPDHVLYLIIYMNAIAMLFAKLKNDVNVHINIAAIVFENDEGAFPFSKSTIVNNHLVTPTGELVLDSIKNYINANINDGQQRNSIFTEDAFDFFLFLTTFNYQSPEVDVGIDKAHNYGVSTELFDVAEQRSRLRYLRLNMKILGAAVDNSNTLRSYVDGAREIAYLLGTSADYFNVHSIMGEYNDGFRQRCSDCLQWSSPSLESLRYYFRQNTNRCFLLNDPRSLHEYDAPRQYLSPATQCSCYTYATLAQESTTLKSNVNNKACILPLPCVPFPGRYSSDPDSLVQRVLKLRRTIPLPVDGTPCNQDKVCWQRQCVPVTSRA